MGFFVIVTITLCEQPFRDRFRCVTQIMCAASTRATVTATPLIQCKNKSSSRYRYRSVAQWKQRLKTHPHWTSMTTLNFYYSQWAMTTMTRHDNIVRGVLIRMGGESFHNDLINERKTCL